MWASLVGKEPENKLTPVKGVTIEDGPWRNGRLQLGRNLADVRRVDATLRAVDSGGGDRPPSLGLRNDAMASIRPLATALFRSGLPIGRMAFGMECFEQAQSIESAFDKLGEHIDPSRFNLTDVRDFIYQINRRPRATAVEGLTINRIGRWVCTVGRFAKSDETAGGIGVDIYAATLHADVNTDPSYGTAFPVEVLEPLFADLQREADHLAEHGDRP